MPDAGGLTIGRTAASFPRPPNEPVLSTKSANACEITQHIKPFSCMTPRAEPALLTASALSLHCSSVHDTPLGAAVESHLTAGNSSPAASLANIWPPCRVRLVPVTILAELCSSAVPAVTSNHSQVHCGVIELLLNPVCDTWVTGRPPSQPARKKVCTRALAGSLPAGVSLSRILNHPCVLPPGKQGGGGRALPGGGPTNHTRKTTQPRFASSSSSPRMPRPRILSHRECKQGGGNAFPSRRRTDQSHTQDGARDQGVSSVLTSQALVTGYSYPRNKSWTRRMGSDFLVSKGQFTWTERGSRGWRRSRTCWSALYPAESG